jgi:DNA-binding response OmpR family regulator
MVDILLVEDNKELAGLMSTFLIRDGYSVYCAMSGEKAEEFMAYSNARLVILDIMLPGIDGFAVCSYIRKRGDIPIIILSARIDKENKMNGFLLGADDYLEKPIDIDILSAKIKALFKRYYDVHESLANIKSGDIVINRDTMTVTYRGNVLNLTIKEYELLLLFALNKGKVLNKDFIFNTIWGADSDSENQTLTVHIKMLRDKIEEDSKNPMRIKTVWGVGYRYEEI